MMSQMTQFSRAVLLLAVSLLVLPATLMLTLSVHAATGPWDQNEEARVRLVAASPTVGNESQLQLGVEFELNPGWKIYWRSPGDAGTPPMLTWPDESAVGVSNSEILWPVPKRFSLFDIQTFGYGDHVILPVTADLASPGTAGELSLRVDYLICEEICIPDQANLILPLGSGPLSPSDAAADIQLYKDSVPGFGAEQGLSLTNVSLSGDSAPATLTAELRSDRALVDPDLLIEGPEGYSYGVPEVTFADDDRRATLSVAVERLFDSGELLTLAGLTVTATDIAPGGVRGIESPASLIGTSLNAADASVAAVGPSLWLILLFALIGGFVLNLMPCVLPVLSLKMLSFVGKGGAARGAIQRSFFATALGIMVSFLLIALVLILLKSVGAAVGWGIQFQQPLFILALIAIIALFSANLFGGFEIALPQSISNAAVQGGERRGLLGDFATGGFATLLATPCSAPFLGTAISFALVQSAPIVLLVFFVLGLGMALPYLAVIAFPGLAQRMPKPGAWMVWLRRLMGVLLLVTIVWLLTVLFAQVGLWGTLAAAAAVLAFIVALTVKGRAATVAKGGAVAAVLALFALPMLLQSAPVPVAPSDEGWILFNEAAIPGRVAAGETMFVDVTADWCVTCKVNKAMVFSDDRLKAKVSSGEIIAMQADWTRPNEEIRAYLNRHGRAGIPFNIVYGPGAPKGIALPELLTPAMVLDALDQASVPTTSAVASN